MKEEKPSFTFDEAIALLHVGAHGFKFTNSKNELFAVTLDHNDRIKVDLVEETEE